MTTDNKIMIELADWMLEVADGDGIITNRMVSEKMGELMAKYEGSLIENKNGLNNLPLELTPMKSETSYVLEDGIDDFWWASNNDNFEIYNSVRKYFGLKEKSESDRLDVLEQLR